MAKLVSKTYGDALFEVALESGRMDEFRDEAVAVKIALKENPELFKLMSHPKIVKEEKVKIIEDIFAEKISAEFVGLSPPDCRKRSFRKSGYGAGLFH